MKKQLQLFLFALLLPVMGLAQSGQTFTWSGLPGDVVTKTVILEPSWTGTPSVTAYYPQGAPFQIVPIKLQPTFSKVGNALMVTFSSAITKALGKQTYIEIATGGTVRIVGYLSLGSGGVTAATGTTAITQNMVIGLADVLSNKADNSTYLFNRTADLNLINQRVPFQSLTSLRSTSLSSLLAPSAIAITDAGKAGTFILDASDSSTPDNTGTVLVTASGLRYKRAYQGNLQAEWFGVTTSGTTSVSVLNNITTACSGGCTVMLPAGSPVTYSGTWSVTPYMKIIGQGQGATKLINTNNSVYAIECLTPILSSIYDINASLSLENLTVNSKFAIRINQTGDFATVFDKQAHIKKVSMTNVDLIGTYGVTGNVDPDAFTSTPISQSAMEAFGVGLKITKLFGSQFTNVRFQGFGTCVSLDGCDINTFTTCRFEGSGRYVYSFFHDTYGSQNLYDQCEWMHNQREGGFYTKDTQFEHIRGGYFESYTGAATHIKTENDRETLIEGVRFDNNRQPTVPVFHFAPAYGLMVQQNRYNPNSYAQAIKMDSTYYDPTRGVLATFQNNAITFPRVQYPAVFTREVDPNRISPTNFTSLGGLGSITWPYKMGINGRPAYKTTTSSIFVYSNPDRILSDSLQLTVLARNNGVGTGYISVTWGSTSVFASNLGFTDTTQPRPKTIGITRPSGEPIDAIITIEMDNTSAEFYEFIFTPIY